MVAGKRRMRPLLSSVQPRSMRERKKRASCGWAFSTSSTRRNDRGALPALAWNSASSPSSSLRMKPRVEPLSSVTSDG